MTTLQADEQSAYNVAALLHTEFHSDNFAVMLYV